jgi:hypothetical protein
MITLTPTPGTDFGRSSISPDGTRAAIVAGNLIVANLTTGSYQDLGVVAIPFRWAPSGNRIAFIDTNRKLRVINADGTGDRIVSNVLFEAIPFSWSPDGEWILAKPTTHYMAVVRVSDGKFIPIQYDMGRLMTTTAWK